MSNGPAIRMKSQNLNAVWINTGQKLKRVNKIKIEAKSNPDFGNLKNMMVYAGETETKSEKLIHKKSFSDNEFETVEEIAFKTDIETGYIRAEVFTSTDHRALTNPIWFGIDGVEYKLD